MNKNELLELVNRSEVLERTLRFSKDVTDENIDKLLEQILALHKISNTEYIVLHLSTPGGKSAQAVSFYETIRLYKPKLIIIASGNCFSAGIPILLASEQDYRFSTKLTEFLIHPTRISVSGRYSVNDLEEEFKNTQSTEKMVIDIITKNTFLDENEVSKLKADDLQMSSDEAKKIGLVSDIL